MTWFLCGLILFALLTFGAVLPWSFLLIALFAILGGAVLFTRNALDGHIEIRGVLLSAVSLTCAYYGSVRLAVILIPAAWAFYIFRKNETVLRFFKILVGFGVAEAVLGLVQSLSAPRWILGYYNSAGSPTSGTLINRNHYAGLIELFVPLALGIAVMEHERGNSSKSYFAGMTAVFMSIALVSSLSRMGIIALFVSVAFIGLLARRRFESARPARFLATLVVSVLMFVLWIGTDVVVERFEKLGEGDAMIRQARTVVYKDTLGMIANNPWGRGLETYRDQFRKYQTWHPELLFDHAHNEYLETASEMGLPLATLLWVCIFWMFAIGVRGYLRAASAEAAGILLGCVGSVTALLVHSLADFNLQIPVNGMLFFMFLGACVAVSRPAQRHNIRQRAF